MAVPASTTTTAQENGELGSRDDHAIEVAGVASCRERAEHAIEIGDPTSPMAAAKELPTELDAGWAETAASMNRRLQEQSTPRASSEPPTIFRVTRNIRDVRPSAYEPRIISFGPYHRGREHLRPMEEHKWRYLRRFLSRQNGSRVLADYMRKMSELEARARRCYADATDEMDANQFAEMMTLDGCFLVEFMLKMEDMQQGEQQLPAGGAEDDDIVFNSTWGYALLMGDMLLLENQLPFFVLLEIWTLFFGPDGCTSKLVWDFLCLFKDLSPANSTYPDPKCPHTLSLLQHHHHHLLHLFHSHVLPMGSQLQGETGEPAPVDDDDDDHHHDTDQRQHLPRREIIYPSATQLTEAGVELRRKEGSTVLEAAFSSHSGEMWISPLRVFDHTEACVRNLIAFEQCFFPRAGNGVSSYAVLVGCLVDTPADVALLKRGGVLVNGLSSDEEAARVIHHLCEDAAYSCHKGKLYEDVNRYRQKTWRRWRAELVHTYFSNPWSSWWWLPPYSCC